MRFPWKTTVLLFLFSTAALMAQKFTIDPASVKIEREFVKAPVFTVQRTYKSLPRPAHEVRWLQVLVSYVPKTVSSTPGPVIWEDDLTVEMAILLPAQEGKGYGKTIMLTGKQVLFSVPGDGKEHYALFLVPPPILIKYTTLASFQSKDIQTSVFVGVFFRKGSSQAVIASAYGVMKNKTPAEVAKLFTSFYNARIGVLRLDDAVLAKEKTPWQWIDTDTFDFPKSMMEGKR